METEGVRLTHFDPSWPQEFEQTKSSLLQSCEGWLTDVQHIGSTAISGIIARPVIDVVAIADGEDAVAHAAKRIEGLNFRECPPAAFAPSCRLLIKPRHGVMTHRVFLAAPGDANVEAMVSIRDHCRSHRSDALEFEEAKVAIWKHSQGVAHIYDELKHQLFAKLLGG